MNFNDSNEELAVSMEEGEINTKIPTKNKQDECPLCAQPSLQILINNALYHKYLDTQYINYLKYMDNIIDNQLSKQAVQFREMAIVDQQEEFMRRMYALSEYDYKNKAIVEYYKFHKDYPKLHVKGVSNIMEAYSDRKKQFEYKKIKRILKKQQNISITTQKSSEIFSDIEDQDKKSHYSNVLENLTQSSIFFNQQNNESQVFKFMCRKIDQAFQSKPLSPINFKKKSIFDQGQNNQAAQTKNFVSYLKKQQEKRQRQEKYKNFIRSNKQSRYNSIEHQNKQYASGASSSSTLIKNITKSNRQRPVAILKGANAFYDGRIFYSNSNNKASFGSMSKQQRTKQQTNLNSQQNTDFDYIFAESGFKKQKESSHNNFLSKNEKYQSDKNYENFATQRQVSHQIELTKSKNMQTAKTTEFIYKNATQEMRLKKRSVSYNSLANNNPITKRTLGVNPLKEKDFEIRNRILSQGQKLLRERNGFLSNQVTSGVNNQGKIKKSISSTNIKTSRSVSKFYQADGIIETGIKRSESTTKKISVPKDMIKALKGNSNSSSKLKSDPESSSRSGNYSQKQTVKQIKKDMNLFIENGTKNKFQSNNLIYTHHPTKNVDIDNLLNKKLFVKQQPQKNKQHKILI